MIAKYVAVACLLLSGFAGLSTAQAKSDVLFHPYDATFEKIVEYFEQANQQIDIAMYNIDTSTRNKVYQYFSRAAVKRRIADGTLEVRMIYQGYSGKEADDRKCARLEKLGIDIRKFAPGEPDGENTPWHKMVKVHHKFAVIDGYSDRPLLITGSANWSNMSRYNYDENILYFDDQPDLARAFQQEFELLWDTTVEFGRDLSDDPQMALPDFDRLASAAVQFNSDNWRFTGLDIAPHRDREEKYHITRQIVAQIDSAVAGDVVKIATTRISLDQIYDAIVAAAGRGVAFDIYVNMDQYKSEARRSSNKSYKLHNGDFKGHENVHVRIKFYNLAFDQMVQAGGIKLPTYLSDQMHSKYLLIEDKWVATGSFNWSRSGEYNHIENLVILQNRDFSELVDKFADNFERIYALNRGDFSNLKGRIIENLREGRNVDCAFAPIALTYDEIDELLGLGSAYDVTLNKDCAM